MTFTEFRICSTAAPSQCVPQEDELPEIEGQPISLGPVVVDSDPTSWTIQIYGFYAKLLKPCPRCNKVCPWIITRSIHPRGTIVEFFLAYAACPCS